MSSDYFIHPEIFERFPAYCRGVVIIEGLHNGPTPAGLTERLRQAEADLRARLKPEEVTTHPRLAAWREGYRALGMKPAEFRPSIEALARRALKGDPLPAISALVDLGNLISLQHLLPVGAHAIDHVTHDLALRPARGDETFEPFGSEANEHPLPGEVIFAEGDIVLTRRWTWRQAKHTLVTLETTAVEINLDGLPPVTPAEVEQISRLTAGLVQQYCGGAVRWAILSQETPRIRLKD